MPRKRRRNMDSDVESDDEEGLEIDEGETIVHTLCGCCKKKIANGGDEFTPRYKCAHLFCNECALKERCWRCQAYRMATTGPTPSVVEAIPAVPPADLTTVHRPPQASPLQVRVVSALAEATRCPICNHTHPFTQLSALNSHLTEIHKVTPNHLSKFYFTSK